MSFITRRISEKRGYLVKPTKRLNSISNIGISPISKRARAYADALVDPFEYHYERPFLELMRQLPVIDDEESKRGKKKKEDRTNSTVKLLKDEQRKDSEVVKDSEVLKVDNPHLLSGLYNTVRNAWNVGRTLLAGKPEQSKKPTDPITGHIRHQFDGEAVNRIKPLPSAPTPLVQQSVVVEGISPLALALFGPDPPKKPSAAKSQKEQIQHTAKYLIPNYGEMAEDLQKNQVNVQKLAAEKGLDSKHLNQSQVLQLQDKMKDEDELDYSSGDDDYTNERKIDGKELPRIGQFGRDYVSPFRYLPDEGWNIMMGEFCRTILEDLPRKDVSVIRKEVVNGRYMYDDNPQAMLMFTLDRFPELEEKVIDKLNHELKRVLDRVNPQIIDRRPERSLEDIMRDMKKVAKDYYQFGRKEDINSLIKAAGDIEDGWRQLRQIRYVYNGVMAMRNRRLNKRQDR